MTASPIQKFDFLFGAQPSIYQPPKGTTKKNMDSIEKKMAALIQEAESTGDKNTVVSMLILKAARMAGKDGMLAGLMQGIAKNVLMPQVKQERDEIVGRQN